MNIGRNATRKGKTERRKAEIRIAHRIGQVAMEIRNLENIALNTKSKLRAELAERNLVSLREYHDKLFQDSCNLELVNG